MKDKAGREIYARHLIIYGHALGRCAGLQYGKVIEIVGKKIRVQGVNSDFEGHFGHKLLRPGFLQFGDRILIVDRNQVPDHTLKILDEVKTILDAEGEQ